MRERAYIYLRYLNIVENRVIEKLSPLIISDAMQVKHILGSQTSVMI